MSKVGFVFTGVVRGVRERTVKAKETGNTLVFHTFIVEGKDFRDLEVNLTQDQVKVGYIEKLNGMAKKLVSFPCHYSLRDGYLNWYLDDLPDPVVDVKPVPASRQAA